MVAACVGCTASAQVAVTKDIQYFLGDMTLHSLDCEVTQGVRGCCIGVTLDR